MERSDPRLSTAYSAQQVRARIEQLADRLAHDYAGTRVTLVVIAEGARRFAAAIADGLERRGVASQWITVTAKRSDGQQLGAVSLEAPDSSRFSDRDLLVIDDIADEGHTLEAVLAHLEKGAPRSCRVAVLVDKRERRKVALEIDYRGFQVERGWVVGFGMDLDGRYRDLDHLAIYREALPR